MASYVLITLALLTFSNPTTASTGENLVNDFSDQPRAIFDNPGGMWMPLQIPERANDLRALGLAIDPTELADPSSNLLQSVVSLGGCSGSFISADGLIITNHHCVQAILSYLSQTRRAAGEDADFVKTGHVARSRDEELWAGPAREIFITTKFAEVTDEVRAGLGAVIDPAARYKMVEARMKEIVKRSEDRDPNVRAEVTAYFRQEKFYLIEKLRIRDVRLVYAPPAAVGYFGGDEHNWHWPRFTGDFALLRPYVAKDGSPAPFAKDNVPYRPARHFKVSRRGLEERDLVMVAGYPGRTERLFTGREFEESVKTDIVEEVADNRRFKKIYDDLAAGDHDLAIKSASARFGLANVIKNRAQALGAIETMKIVDRRLAADRELNEWINAADERRAEHGGAIEALATLHNKYEDDEATKRTLAFWRAPILGRAMTIVRKGEQSVKEDAARDQAFQKRNWDVVSNADKQAQGTLDPRIDRAILAVVIERLLELPRAAQPAVLDDLFGADRDVISPGRVSAVVTDVLDRSALYDLEARQKLLKDAENGPIVSEDSVLKIARALLPFALARIERGRAQAGDYLTVAPGYVRAKRAFLAARGQSLAPDANSSLRVTFGQVLDQRKSSDGQTYPAFTTLEGLLGQDVPGKQDFEIPANVKNAIKGGVHAPFASADGRVPVNFLGNVDTTGGNSGSAALNARGELVGLLFDGNEETLYSDWHFDNDVRSIMVDARYFLWTLFNVEKAHHLLREMDVTPGCADLLRD